MSTAGTSWSRRQLALLALLILTLVIESLLGIGWGLPTAERMERLIPRNREQVLVKLARQSTADAAEKALISNAVPLSGQTAPASAGCLSSRPVALLRATRRFLSFPCDWDEPHIIRCLAGMKPSQGDFNPRIISYGGLAIYPVGALIKLGVLSHYLPPPSVDAYLAQPEAFARMYRIGRGWILFLILASVLAVAWAGTQMYSPEVGLLAAIWHATSTPLQAFLTLMKPHIPLTGLVALVFGFCARALRRGERRDLLWAAVACGLAASLAPTAATAALVIGISAILFHRAPGPILRTWLLTGAIAAGVFLLLNPYCLLDLNSLRQEADWQYKLYEWSFAKVNLWRFLTMQIVNAFPWPLLALMLAGVLAPSPVPVWPGVVLVLVVCAQVLYQVAGRLEPAYIRYCAVVFPIFSIWAAAGVVHLRKSVPLVGTGLTVWAAIWVLGIASFYAADRIDGATSAASQERAAPDLVSLVPAGERVGLVYEAVPRQLPAMDLERWCLETYPSVRNEPAERLPAWFITTTATPPAPGFQVVGRWIDTGKLAHLEAVNSEDQPFVDYLEHRIVMAGLSLAFPLHLHQVPVYLHHRANR